MICRVRTRRADLVRKAAGRVKPGALLLFMGIGLFITLLMLLAPTASHTALAQGKETPVPRPTLALPPTWTPVPAAPVPTLAAPAGSSAAISLDNASMVVSLMTLSGHTERVSGVAFSPDGRWLASSANDSTVRFWDLASGGTPGSVLRLEDEPYDVTFNRTGTLLALTAGQSIALVESATQSIIRQWAGHSDTAWMVEFSPDGRIVASASSDRTVRIWDVASGSSVRVLSGLPNPSLALAMSPDGLWLVGGSGRFDSPTGEITVWDLATGTQQLVLRGHTGGLMDLEFSHDGRLLASASFDTTVRLWDVEAGRELAQLRGHTEWARAVAFSPDDSMLVSAGWDEVLRLWSVAEQRELAVLTGHTDHIEDVVFSPDGTRLASGGEDATIRIWGLPGALPAGK